MTSQSPTPIRNYNPRSPLIPSRPRIRGGLASVHLALIALGASVAVNLLTVTFFINTTNQRDTAVLDAIKILSVPPPVPPSDNLTNKQARAYIEELSKQQAEMKKALDFLIERFDTFSTSAMQKLDNPRRR